MIPLMWMRKRKLLRRLRAALLRWRGTCQDCDQPRIGDQSVSYFPHLMALTDYCFDCARRWHKVGVHASNYGMGPRRLRAVR